MIGYLDMPSGLSGDMFLGCLLAAGWPLAELQETLDRLSLPPGSWSMRAEQVMRGPLAATLAAVDVTEAVTQRNLDDLKSLLAASDLPSVVEERTIAVFSRLAEAEAGVHGIEVNEVHFHEVGALDAIIDVVGVVAGLHALGVERLYASPVPLGYGWVKSAHGSLPVPAPATLALLTAAQAPVRPAPGPGELVTPTGAALLAEFATFEQPAMHLLRTATGAGQRQFDWPNVARLLLGQPSVDGSQILLETNIDDMNPELYGTITGRLFDAGALDVWLTAVQMKKGRPGVVLSVLAGTGFETVLADLILRETTTLGLRVQSIRRYEADRAMKAIETPFGKVRVKLKILEGRTVAAVPEFGDCERLAAVAHVPTRQVYESAQAIAYTRFME